MNTSSTITLERPTPQLATITFTNAPVNLVVAETVIRLHEIVADLIEDPFVFTDAVRKSNTRTRSTVSGALNV